MRSTITSMKLGTNHWEAEVVACDNSGTFDPTGLAISKFTGQIKDREDLQEFNEAMTLAWERINGRVEP